MFYKDNYLSEDLTKKLKLSPEFIYTLFQKMNYLPFFSLGHIQGLDKKGNIIYQQPIVLKSAIEDNSHLYSGDSQDRHFNSYITVEGVRSLFDFSQQYLLEKVQRENNKVHSIKVSTMTEEQFIELYPFNNKKLQLAHSLLKDFFNVAKEGIIKDKFNQEYEYCIITNKDPSISDTLLLDEIILFAPQINGSKGKTNDIYNGKVKIASIKAKYTTPDILEKLYFSPYNNEEYTYDTIARPAFNQKKPLLPIKQQLPYIEKYPHKNIKNNHHYQTHITQYEEEIKNNIFNQVATIDFSYVDEQYQHRGLGYALYFHMAQHLNAKNIEFRQSSLCSSSATALWQAYETYLPDLISKKQISNKLLSFLTVPQNINLEFKNSLPIISIVEQHDSHLDKDSSIINEKKHSTKKII